MFRVVSASSKPLKAAVFGGAGFWELTSRPARRTRAKVKNEMRIIATLQSPLMSWLICQVAFCREQFIVGERTGSQWLFQHRRETIASSSRQLDNHEKRSTIPFSEQEPTCPPFHEPFPVDAARQM